MPDLQITLRPPDFVTQAQPLPETFIRWQLDTRRAMLEAIARGGQPRRFAAHLPVMITFNGDGPFPARAATKGAGFTPADETLDQYIGLLEDALARCAGRPWEETLAERVAAVQALLDHPEDIDPHRLGCLEIFRGGTYANLQHDPRVVLHYTGDGPHYPSFQINGWAEILGPDDPRYRYIALARRIFEEAPFHLKQPGYAAAYLVWVQEALDKTPHSLERAWPADGRYNALVVPPTAGSVVSSPPAVVAQPGADGARRSAKPPCPEPKAPYGQGAFGSGTTDVTFREILVALDNSPYSAWATEMALPIAKAFGSTVVGSHIYAARLHDRRFRDMEPGLPEEYQQPTILAHQRQLHDTLIEKGLKLISDSYLEILKQRCQQAELRFVGKTPEGKNYAELVRDIEANRYDLVVMGVRGIGEVWRHGERRDQVLGSVCARVTRRVSRDVLVVKDNRPLAGVFVVGVDGSDRGFAALRVALALAGTVGAQVQAVAAYDPFLHRALFHELEDVLTAEAKQVFNTEQQKKLHDMLIDRGIAKIYQGHLETAQRMAAEAGVAIETHLLVGKPFAAVLRRLEQAQPSLLVLGRTGIHADRGLDIGSNAENLLRLAPCHVLLVGRTLTPTRAETRQMIEAHLPWTPEALARLERVPEFARGMARQAIEDYARQQGLDLIDEQAMQEARERLGM